MIEEIESAADPTAVQNVWIRRKALKIQSIFLEYWFVLLAAAIIAFSLWVLL